MEDAPLASLSLTHVHYNPEDAVSYFCAWLALVPQGLCVTYITLIWATREVEVILMFAGQMGCEALNFLLKRLIKEERPKQMYGKGYGMPSSHAQFMAFFAVYLTLFLLLRHRPSTPFPGRSLTAKFLDSIYPSPEAQRFLVSAGTVLLAALVACSRTYLNYHTSRQVLVGCSAGITSGIAWFLVTSLARSDGLLAILLDLELCKWLRLRDLVVDEDLVECGWKEWEKRRHVRQSQKMRKPN